MAARLSAFRKPERWFLRNALLLGAVALLALGGAGCSRPPSEPSPPVEVVNLDEPGFERVRERHRGRVLLINFWATWCEPCRDEFPDLVRLHRNYRTRGLSLVAISMDEPESVPAIQQFLVQQNAAFGSYRHNFRSFSRLIDSINPRWSGGIPASFLYDRQGKLAASWLGATKYEDFERAVRLLLP